MMRRRMRWCRSAAPYTSAPPRRCAIRFDLQLSAGALRSSCCGERRRLRLRVRQPARRHRSLRRGRKANMKARDALPARKAELLPLLQDGLPFHPERWSGAGRGRPRPPPRLSLRSQRWRCRAPSIHSLRSCCRASPSRRGAASFSEALGALPVISLSLSRGFPCSLCSSFCFVLLDRRVDRGGGGGQRWVAWRDRRAKAASPHPWRDVCTCYLAERWNTAASVEGPLLLVHAHALSSHDMLLVSRSPAQGTR